MFLRPRTSLAITLCLFTLINLLCVMTLNRIEADHSKEHQEVSSENEKRKKFLGRPLDNHFHPFDESQVDINESIFFIETRLTLKPTWPSRLGCALESVVSQNPGRKVFVMIPEETEMAGYPKYLMKLPGLFFVKADFLLLSRGTPGAEMWENGKLESAKIRIVCTSELMRLVLLYKYGGIFLDMDYIFKAPLPWDVENFFASQYNGNVNGALMKFGRGHPYLQLTLKNYVSYFDTKYEV